MASDGSTTSLPDGAGRAPRPSEGPSSAHVLPPIAGPAGPAPARTPGSVRRTATLDADFPDGERSDIVIRARARDLLTRTDGTPVILGEAGLDARVARDRTILHLRTWPDRPALQSLVGVPNGGNLRGLAGRAIAEDRDAGAPLYLLCDDLSVMTLIAWYAFSQWLPARRLPLIAPPVLRGGMADVCHSLRQGAEALGPGGFPRVSEQNRDVGPLTDVADAWAWHELPTDSAQVSMRRARRIDVRRDEGVVFADTFFQDSMKARGGGRRAVHEYLVSAEVEDGPGPSSDARTPRLRALQADPRVVPYRECPAVVLGLPALLGTPARDLRREVLHRLGGTRGCTHLNDALRALAEVPCLAAQLPDDGS